MTVLHTLHLLVGSLVGTGLLEALARQLWLSGLYLQCRAELSRR
jgi:hypothetical protein